MKNNRVAIIIQRFDESIIGGAEIHAQKLVEQWTRRLGWSVDVYTSRANNFETWANDFPETCEIKNRQLRIFRFSTKIKRFFLFKLFEKLSRFSSIFEKLFFILQGPYCPDLIKMLYRKKDDYQKIFFMTYLYYPTAIGIQKLKNEKNKIYFIPLFHDEPPFYFLTNKKNIDVARKILVNTEYEIALSKNVCGQNITNKMSVTGVGIEVPQIITPKKFLFDYFLYLGRLGPSKNVDLLMAAYEKYYARTKTKIHLMLVGPPEENFVKIDHPMITILDPVQEHEKWSLVAHAKGIINPSRLESLSLIVLEAIACKKPVLVHEDAQAIKAYTSNFSSINFFKTEQDLTDKLNWLEKFNDEIQLDHAQKEILKRFSWENILKEYNL